MSLHDPPHLEPRIYVPCTCGAAGRNALRHEPHCATQDTSHEAWEAASEKVEGNAREWFGRKGRER